jgi:hypothetical protein
MNTNSIKSASVTVIKTIVAPVHVTLQASADLLALGEAKLINSIDGTPVIESVFMRTSHTQNKIEQATAKAMEIYERRAIKKEKRRQEHIESLKAKLDHAEGIEHMEVSVPKPLVYHNNYVPDNINNIAFVTPLQSFEQ